MMKELAVCPCVLLLFFVTASCGAVLASYTAPDVVASEDAVSSVQKRQFDMMRFARGLQMLRLGKREAPALSKNQWLDFLAALFDQDVPREESRRQPPLPRYGRRSVGLGRRPFAGGAKTNQRSRLFSIDLSTVDDPVFRQPPRGGRYKRSSSAPDAPIALGPQAGQGAMFDGRAYYRNLYIPGNKAASRDGDKQAQRAVNLPRIGRYLDGALHDMKTKAVPHPRIGRESESESSQENMADPRGA